MTRVVVCVLSFTSIVACSGGNDEPTTTGKDVVVGGVHSFLPDSGFIPDSLTAIKVAEALLIPIYGAKQLRSELPLKAFRSDSNWIVEGSIPRDNVGGVVHIELGRRDGRVLRVTHDE
jgi:hypothetical protein